MDSLLPTFQKLEEALSVLGPNAQLPPLPQIVVVGSQSSGKSSVLEALVGRDFLPRGTGIVTRRPLLLQLVHTPASGAGPHEWGEFRHLPDRKFADFGEIRAEIAAETERALGRSKKVSSEPIRLRIYSPHVLNLSLVDLPGVTKVPVGDQPADIEVQLRTMVLEYIENPNAIVLAVSAATSDIATSDAIQLAKRVDPAGERTMGVVTKLDLMDAGTDAVDVLSGRIIPLARGFVGVVNRSQQDIDQAKPLDAARRAERAFFDGHPRYRPLAATMGTEYLGRALNGLLLAHVRDSLPELRTKVAAAAARARADLASYGDAHLDGKSNQGALLLQLITTFTTNYCDAIDGTSAEVQRASRERGELQGGARINAIFRGDFYEALASLDACTGLADDDITHAIKQATGPRSPLFVPEVAFEVLARRQIELLRPACVHAVDAVAAELGRMLPSCLPPQLQRFAVLRGRMQLCAQGLLARCAAPASEMVGNLLAIEGAYLNTSHPDFLGGTQAMALIANHLQNGADFQGAHNGMAPPPPPPPAAPPRPPPDAAPNGGANGDIDDPLRRGVTTPRAADSSVFMSNFFGSGKRPAETPAVANGARAPPPAAAAAVAAAPVRAGHVGSPAEQRERLETQVIRSLLVSYFSIVKKNLQDSVPKAIMHFLVNAVRREIQNELVGELYKEGDFDEMLQQEEAAVRRRQHCVEVVRALDKATEVLAELKAMRSEC